MGANSLIWLCIGAGVVLFLMVLVILLVFRPSAANRNEFRLEYRRSPPPAASPPSGEIPYGIDRRAMPMSEDLELLLTAKRETDAEFPDEPQQFVCGQDPSFLKTSNKLGAFMAWTRGGYYFSAHAKGGEADLNVFMEAFGL